MSLTIASSITQLNNWSVITVTGPDATDFLQNQLTNSVKSIQPITSGMVATAHTQNRFAGYCSAKGRLMASFWISRINIKSELGEEVPQYHLLISSDLAQTLSKRLSMFVLRSKVKVIDQTDQFKVYGLLNVAQSGVALLEKVITTGINVAELPAVNANGINYQRYLLICSPDEETQIADICSNNNLATETWNWLEVQSGIPRVTQSTYEQFVPQMINMESLKGIDFQKGCYPGQEVVARSQYRGTIKRRLQIGHINIDTDVAVGTEIYHSEDPSQPCGMVVLSASHPNISQRIDIQAECKLEALDHGSIHLGSVDGPTIQFATLPYPLIEI
jgi:folate-binding protein YgfZ